MDLRMGQPVTMIYYAKNIQGDLPELQPLMEITVLIAKH